VHAFTAGSVVVELGCGSASKTGILINELIERDGAAAVRFVGIDCSAAALEMAQSSLLKSCPGLQPQNIELVCAEYNDGAIFIRLLKWHFAVRNESVTLRMCDKSVNRQP
jgi:uncharacterized SAM-dependent methyltransferase